MKKYTFVFLICILCIAFCDVVAEQSSVIESSAVELSRSGISSEQSSSQRQQVPVFFVTEVPQEVKVAMQRYSWRQGCPLPLEELVYLSVSYWGYDEALHQGELIVHRQLAEEVLLIFRDLFEAKFPIEKIRLIDAYGGDDNLSMADNNSSGFNCRMSAGNSKSFSKHSYGAAIDINPLINPYVKKGRVLPSEGRKYVDRQRSVKGMIQKGDSCYTAFIKRGWRWGGGWKNSKDYQHFEKDLRPVE